MISRLAIGLVALISLTAFAPAPLPRPPKKPAQAPLLQQLQGTWQMVGTERLLNGGRRITSKTTAKIRIEKNRWSYVYDNGGKERVGVTYNISLDPSRTPAWFDLSREGNPQPQMKGVIGLDGDTLRFCYVLGSRSDLGRPFNTNLGEGQILMTLRRLRP